MRHVAAIVVFSNSLHIGIAFKQSALKNNDLKQPVLRTNGRDGFQAALRSMSVMGLVTPNSVCT